MAARAAGQGPPSGRGGPSEPDGWDYLGQPSRGSAPPSGGGLAAEVVVLVVLTAFLYAILGVAVVYFVVAIALVTLVAYGVLRVSLRILTGTGFAARFVRDEEDHR